MKKRVVSLALVVGLVGSMFVGCGSDNNGNDDPTVGDDSVKPYYEVTGNDKDKDINVSWFVVGGKDEYYQHYWKEMKGVQAIQKITGVNITFEVATGYEAYLPMFSAKNYPDVITAKNLEQYPGRLGGMYNDGVSLKLNDYMSEWMPNFAKIVKDYPDIARDLKMDDGSYTFVSAIYDVNNSNDRTAASQYGLAIRKDWLTNLGYEEVPTTIDEWYEVLLDFKKQDPNGDNIANEEPVCMASSGWKYFLAAYGIDDDPVVMKADDGTETVVYGFITDEYKEYLTEMKKWSDEGLIYNMFENTSLEKRQERVTGNYAGAWKGDAAHFDEEDSSSYINKLRENVPEAEFAAVPWPLTKDGYQWCFSDISSFDRDTTIISNNAKAHGTDKAAAYIIDYMLSEKGSTLLTWGIKGESYEEKNGEKQLKDGMGDSVDFYDTKIPKKYTYADPITVMLPQFGEMSDYVLANKSEGYVEACSVWSEGDTSYKVSAACQLSVSQQQEVTKVTDGMKEYIGKMRKKFIEGKAPLTEYDAYVAQVKQLGGDRYAEIWGEAYNNYKNR